MYRCARSVIQNHPREARKHLSDGKHNRRFLHPLIAMKIAGHTDYKTTANIYTHVRDGMLKKATVNMGEVFGSREKG